MSSEYRIRDMIWMLKGKYGYLPKFYDIIKAISSQFKDGDLIYYKDMIKCKLFKECVFTLEEAHSIYEDELRSEELEPALELSLDDRRYLKEYTARCNKYTKIIYNAKRRNKMLETRRRQKRQRKK